MLTHAVLENHVRAASALATPALATRPVGLLAATARRSFVAVACAIASVRTATRARTPLGVRVAIVLEAPAVHRVRAPQTKRAAEGPVYAARATSTDAATPIVPRGILNLTPRRVGRQQVFFQDSQ